jgi:hypothetical protein
MIVAGVATATVGTAALGYMMYDEMSNDDYKTLLEMLNEAGISVEDEFRADKNLALDKLQVQFENGLISKDKLENEQAKLESNSTVEYFAKKSKNPKVQAVVAEYNENYNKELQESTEFAGDMFAPVCAMLGGMSCACVSSHVYNKLRNADRDEISEDENCM